MSLLDSSMRATAYKIQLQSANAFESTVPNRLSVTIDFVIDTVVWERFASLQRELRLCTILREA